MIQIRPTLSASRLPLPLSGTGTLTCGPETRVRPRCNLSVLAMDVAGIEVRHRLQISQTPYAAARYARRCRATVLGGIRPRLRVDFFSPSLRRRATASLRKSRDWRAWGIQGALQSLTTCRTNLPRVPAPATARRRTRREFRDPVRECEGCSGQSIARPALLGCAPEGRVRMSRFARAGIGSAFWTK